MRFSWFVLVVMLVLASIASNSFSQSRERSTKLHLPLGNWAIKEYGLRPPRRLSLKEAQDWVADIAKRGLDYNRVHAVQSAVLIQASTADSSRLAKLIRSKEEDKKLAALAEIGIRKDKSLFPDVRKLVLADDMAAYRVYRSLDPSRAGLVKLYQDIRSGRYTKNQAAVNLLQIGDTRGVKTVREAIKTRRDFIINTAAGWLKNGEVCYLLIRYADGNDPSRIAEDMKGADLTMRFHFPALAKLTRSNIDKVILAKADDPYHGVRKWVAVAARERANSAAYRNILKKLSQDPVQDVRDTALWALGKGEKPRNLNHLIRN
jgi:hypothetical protein